VVRRALIGLQRCADAERGTHPDVNTMASGSRARILCVDDESNVLDGLRRALRGFFDVTTAVGANEGMDALEQGEEFAVVVSDLRMPVMDGIAFLEHARRTAPDASRVLLTGNADLHSALEAVNRGAIFRFMTKPCAPEALRRALTAAVEQHHLVTSERVLLEQTLHGSIKALTDVLALINPAGFGRAGRVKAIVGAIAERLGHPGRWQLEVAAMLSQIGTVSLPSETVEKLYAGAPLTHSEVVRVERLPRVACDVIASIPRLEEVREILAHQNHRFDGGPRGRTTAGEAIPWGARLLKVAFDFDLLESQGLSSDAAISTLRGRDGWYDPDLLVALAEHLGYGNPAQEVMEIELAAVRSGMVFVEDIRTTTGILLIARGQEVTERLAERIRNSLHMLEARQKVHVIVPARPATPPVAATLP
jgi:response regulator RpfG family c-di-GMP phosphodiesterase